MKRSEEHALIQRAAAGDRSAAEAFIRAFQGQLYSFILRLSGKPDVAEDIVQDAFVRVLTNLHRFDPRYRFSTWLFTIARRLYINRGLRRRPVSSSELVEMNPGSAGNADLGRAATAESVHSLSDHVQRALAHLSLEQREILLLFHQQGWPIWLIAQHLELPEGTVKSHLHRGRRRLRQLLTQTPGVERKIEEALT